MSDISRRHFFKRLAMIAGCAVITPSVSLERLEHPDFVPGMRIRKGTMCINSPHAKHRSIDALNYWFENDAKVPPGFRHGIKKFSHSTKDYGDVSVTILDYQSPKTYRKCKNKTPLK